MESESPIIIQMLKNVKQIIDVSKSRGLFHNGKMRN